MRIYLLNENRQETLKKKYSSKFDEELLDFFLNLAFFVDTNHKYSDFFLKIIDPESRTIDTDIDDAIETISDFDKFQSSLTQKDINQYKTLEELKYALIIPKTKFEEKKLEKEVDKIYEDSKFLVIIPKSQEASCKYGANTKWCVTQRNTGHFETYTRGNQILYFVINKENSTDDNYSKIAIHFDSNGVVTYYDSKDEVLKNKEIRILNFAFPELMQKIREDYKLRSSSKMKSFLNKVFDSKEVLSKVFKNFNYSDLNLAVKAGSFSLQDTNQSQGRASISIQKANQEKFELIDDYFLEISFSEYSSSIFNIEVHFVPVYEPNTVEFDFGLKNKIYTTSISLETTVEHTAKKFIAIIINEIYDSIFNNKPFLEKYSSKKIWFSNRFYGYKFEKNEGLIKKLVDWLDSGEKGTKLDFLQTIGKLEKKMIEGEPHYKIPNDSQPWRTSRDLRGHFSSFFASARNAGIIDYEKVGNKFIIKKGPNFEDFKKEKLKSF